MSFHFSSLLLQLACVTWSDTDFDPLEWPVQTVLSTDVSLRGRRACMHAAPQESFIAAVLKHV